MPCAGGFGTDGSGVGDIRTAASGAWLFERIVTTGRLVLNAAGGSKTGSAAACCYLSSLHTHEINFAPVVARLGQTCEGSTAYLQNSHPLGMLAWLSWIVALLIRLPRCPRTIRGPRGSACRLPAG